MLTLAKTGRFLPVIQKHGLLPGLNRAMKVTHQMPVGHEFTQAAPVRSQSVKKSLMLLCDPPQSLGLLFHGHTRRTLAAQADSAFQRIGQMGELLTHGLQIGLQYIVEP